MDYMGRAIYDDRRGLGAVIGHHPATRYAPESVDLRYDDGGEQRKVGLACFAGADPCRRFWWAAEWQADRQRKAAQFEDYVRAQGIIS